ncbi:MAG: hypothetical protein RJA70_1098 [Pseudomonadota bacterium]|jgi:hypothetical protein
MMHPISFTPIALMTLGLGAFTVACASEDGGMPINNQPGGGMGSALPEGGAAGGTMDPGPGLGMGGGTPATGGTTANGGAGGTTANGGTPATGGTMANGGTPGAGGSMANGGTPGAGGTPAAGGAGNPDPMITLDGAPPPPQTFAVNADFELLPANAMFSHFIAEGDRVQLEPLKDPNFPPGFDWRHAPGRDVELNEKHLYGRAALNGTLKEWYYDVTLDHCGESDGESVFRLVVNGVVAREQSAAPSNNNTCNRLKITWPRVAIPAGAKIEVHAKPHSNLKIYEDLQARQFDCAGLPPKTCSWAWARARWYGIEFVPTAQ